MFDKKTEDRQNMIKSLLFLAFVLNIFIIVSSYQGTKSKGLQSVDAASYGSVSTFSSSGESSSASSSESESYSKSSSTFTSSSSSSSNSESSSSSSATAFVTENCYSKKPKTPKCGKNEEYSTCLNGGCYGARNCTEIGKKEVICINRIPSSCIKGCVCKKGYYRNSDGICVPPNQCDNNLPVCTNPNEKYSVCPGVCPEAKCGVDPAVILCLPNPEVGDPECEPGCVCYEGYLKNSEGICIPKEQCPNEPVSCNGDPNAISTECGSACPKTCLDNGEDKICTLNCLPCTCKPGYIVDDNTGKCILPENCPKLKCKANETYVECPDTYCSAQTCDQLGYPLNCTYSSSDETTKCTQEPACLCQDGFVRDKNGICIAQNECPSCGGDSNSQVGCGNLCTKRCSDSDDNPRICPLICQLNACTCKPGYVIDDNTGKCILPGQCPPKCGKNEVFSNCTNGGCYGARNCTEIGIKEVICIKRDESTCLKGCICKEGNYRNSNGICVPQNQCDDNLPSCDNPNEEFNVCPATCPEARCDVDPTVIRCKRNPEVGDPDCEPGCKCYEGFLKNSDGNCIPKDQCPPKPVCTGLNEEYNPCLDPCDPQTCESLYEKFHCPFQSANTTDCKGGCICKSGHRRNALGNCITVEQCQQCTGPNEVFSCGSACDTECATLGQQCPVVNIKCNEKCYCKDGYARDSNNTCIPIDECPEQCTGPNEVFSCGSACDTECATLGQQCPVVNIKCNEKCYCKDGYARDSNNTCIPIDECPAQCPGGSTFNTCPSQPCDAEKCPLTRDSPTACRSTRNCGTPRCTCGFNEKIDRETGKCISIRDCPPFECNKPNEEYQACPPFCPGETCTDFLNNATCTKIGRIGIVVPCQPQCRCKEGFYRDYQGFCVEAEECKKEQCTGPNEFFSCGQECDNECGNPYENRTNCSKINIQCNKKCYCKDGFSRDPSGICIPNEDCPAISTKCPDDGSSFNTCPPPQPCDADNCPLTRDSPTSCISTRNCGTPRCTCGFNQKRNIKTGECVDIRDCPAFVCDRPNEVYRACPPVCPGQTCKDYINNSTCPKYGKIGITVSCQPQCRCKDGYFRNDQEICVKGEECIKDPVCSGVNEEFSTCTQSLCRLQNCSQLGTSPVCIRLDPRYCNRGCVCKESFLKNEKGICVPENQCKTMKEPKVKKVNN